jgi:hypothetical protein
LQQMSKKRPTRSRIKEREEKVCLNCGASMVGRFCHECGQENIEQKISIGAAIVEFLNAFTFYDSKFFKTFVPLIIKPGLLVNEYISGKRTQYLSPSKTYFFLSFIFFLIFFSVGPTQEGDLLTVDNSGNLDSVTRNARREHSVLAITVDSSTSVLKYDSIQNTLPVEERDGAVRRWFAKKAIKVVEKMQNEPQALSESLNNQFNSNLPQLVFLLMPLVAVILKLLYLRKKIYLIDHLMFSLNIHCFVFLWFTIMIIISVLLGLATSPIMMLIFIIILTVYIFLAIKSVYKQNWFFTSAKTLFLLAFYGVLLITGMLVNTIYSLATVS